ncbi:F-box only protein 5 [Papilio machaon]|uniref:F-box only protein 5 n=1 Tax=Papilio machaon TaxID=76193 RepID=A0A194RH32_PAPMA|nr:uncharacterized protein LOC106709008 [Papilio machaon]KPJ16749.1 F-box only protein 5 [Papilio machaon]
MDFHSNFMEPATPAITYDNINRFSKNEDSGYHTSYTPGSFQYSEISDDSLNSVVHRQFCQIQVECFDITPDVKVRLSQRYKCSSSISFENNRDSPASRRGVKRPFQEEIENVEETSSIPTPTTLIAGCLRKLKFSDGSKMKSKGTNRCTNTILQEFNYQHECGASEMSYPTTPVKKVCRSSCKLNSPLSLRRPAKKLITHSLSCDIELLEPVKQPSAVKVKSYHIKPNKKIDIIKMLYEHAAMPPIMEIFKYLSNEDIYNFSLVSDTWLKVWDEVSKKLTVKQKFVQFMQSEKENQENKGTTPKDMCHRVVRIPMGIHNVAHTHSTKSSVTSPPGTPRTNKFKKFTKAASLDSRVQVVCSRCDQPAKVNQEDSDEEWVECTNDTCAYQFCRFCRCDRHPGRKCRQYDLEGPSPTKRKKTSFAICTKKSKRILRRLL